MSVLKLLGYLLLFTISCFSENISSSQALATVADSSNRAVVYISKDTIQIKDQRRMPFYFRIAKIEDSSGYSYLHFNERFKSKAKEIDFAIENDDNSIDIFHLPPNMSKRLIEYFRISPLKPFDCYSFGHFLNSVSYGLRFFSLSKWEKCFFNENLLQTGDSIVIFTIKDGSIKKFNHFAIYIGNGLYLSKGGVSGPLVVSDLDIMKSAFGGNQVYQLRRENISKRFKYFFDLAYQRINIFLGSS